MKAIYVAVAVLIPMWCGSEMSAHAAPPTVTPSPGYDARLQEQRAASQNDRPAVPAPVVSHRNRRHRH